MVKNSITTGNQELYLEFEKIAKERGKWSCDDRLNPQPDEFGIFCTELNWMTPANIGVYLPPLGLQETIEAIKENTATTFRKIKVFSYAETVNKPMRFTEITGQKTRGLIDHLFNTQETYEETEPTLVLYHSFPLLLEYAIRDIIRPSEEKTLEEKNMIHHVIKYVDYGLGRTWNEGAFSGIRYDDPRIRNYRSPDNNLVSAVIFSLHERNAYKYLNSGQTCTREQLRANLVLYFDSLKNDQTQ